MQVLRQRLCYDLNPQAAENPDTRHKKTDLIGFNNEKHFTETLRSKQREKQFYYFRCKTVKVSLSV